MEEGGGGKGLGLGFATFLRLVGKGLFEFMHYWIRRYGLLGY